MMTRIRWRRVGGVSAVALRVGAVRMRDGAG